HKQNRHHEKRRGNRPENKRSRRTHSSPPPSPLTPRDCNPWAFSGALRASQKSLLSTTHPPFPRPLPPLPLPPPRPLPPLPPSPRRTLTPPTPFPPRLRPRAWRSLHRHFRPLLQLIEPLHHYFVTFADSVLNHSIPGFIRPLLHILYFHGLIFALAFNHIHK